MWEEQQNVAWRRNTQKIKVEKNDFLPSRDFYFFLFYSLREVSNSYSDMIFIALTLFTNSHRVISHKLCAIVCVWISLSFNAYFVSSHARDSLAAHWEFHRKASGRDQRDGGSSSIATSFTYGIDKLFCFLLFSRQNTQNTLTSRWDLRPENWITFFHI